MTQRTIRGRVMATRPPRQVNKKPRETDKEMDCDDITLMPQKGDSFGRLFFSLSQQSFIVFFCPGCNFINLFSSWSFFAHQKGIGLRATNRVTGKHGRKQEKCAWQVPAVFCLSERPGLCESPPSSTKKRNRQTLLAHVPPNQKSANKKRGLAAHKKGRFGHFPKRSRFFSTAGPLFLLRGHTKIKRHKKIGDRDKEKVCDPITALRSKTKEKKRANGAYVHRKKRNKTNTKRRTRANRESARAGVQRRQNRPRDPKTQKTSTRAWDDRGSAGRDAPRAQNRPMTWNDHPMLGAVRRRCDAPTMTATETFPCPTSCWP